MTPDMARRRAIVTGAGKGIGGPCARLLGWLSTVAAAAGIARTGRTIELSRLVSETVICVNLTCVFLTRGPTRATGRTSPYHRRRVDHTRRL